MSDDRVLEGDLLPKADEEYLEDMPVQVNTSVDPSDVIKTTQGIRLAMVKKHLKRGVPDLDKDSAFLMQTLRDLDSAALTTRKIDVEEKGLDDAERVAMAHTELLRLLGGRNPFVADGKSDLPVARREEPELPEVEIVPGLTDIGTHPIDFDQFSEAVNADDPES